MAILSLDDLSVEVTRTKIKDTLLFPEPKPYTEVNGQPVQLENTRVYFNRQTGEMIGTKEVVSYQDELRTADGKTIPRDQAKWFVINEKGKLESSTPYQRSKVIQGLFPIQVQNIGSYVASEAYEVYVNPSKYNTVEYRRMVERLYKKAEEWFEKDKAEVGQWVHREGSKPYAMLLYPYMKEEDGVRKFVFVMVTSRGKYEFQHMMDAPQTVTVTLIEEPKTEQLLKAFAK